MITDTLYFVLKATCIIHFLSFCILPILCGSVFLSLMVALFKRTFVMGLNCFKDGNDDGQREQSAFQVNTLTVTKQPRPISMTTNKINCKDYSIMNSTQTTELQDKISKEKLSGGKPQLEKDDKNTKPKRKTRKRNSTKSDKIPRNPPDETGTGRDVETKSKKRNKNLKDEQLKHGSESIRTGTGVTDLKRPKLSIKTQSVSNEKILLEFEKKLQEDYQEQFQGGQPHQFWFDVRMQKDSGDVGKRFCTLNKLLPPKSSKWRMLVYGLPRFGKSQLCQDLTSIWVSLSDGNVKHKCPNFKFWILFQLCEKNVVDLEKSIVGKCYSYISKDTTTDDFQNAWRSQIDCTLIILDGYDNLNQKQKLHVKSFIRENTFFDGASFLLMSRPNNDSDLGNMFNIQADICGLSEATLTHWLGKEKNSDARSIGIKQLYGVSPFFAQAAAKVYSEGGKPQSLYDLIDTVMDMTFQNVAFKENEVNVLGQFLAKRLKYRKFIFKQNELPELLQEKCEILKERNIFISCSPEHGTCAHLVVSHMIFMLYFCIKYLQEECNKLSSRDDQKALFKRYLSFEDSSEEYYRSSEKPVKTYMVGLVPEIVFEVESSSFEMVPDIENSIRSSAFETQSLLLRADRTQLEMLGIVEVEELLIQDRFEALLNMLDFSDLTIERSYFTLTGSSFGFMKLTAMNDEENERLAMLSVASSNEAGQIQDITLEFKESEMKKLSSFIQKLVELFFGPCQLDINNGGPQLIMSIVLSALSSSRNYYTTLSLCSNSQPLSLVTWEVISGSQNKPRSSFVHTAKNKTVSQKYDFQQLQENPIFTELIETMKNCVDQLHEGHICIKINR